MEFPAVDQNVTATYTKISGAPMSGCEQKEANFHLYLHQITSGPNKNQTVSVNSTLPNGFGAIAINDWVILEGADPTSKLVARAHGLHTQSSLNGQQWYFSSSIVFEDNGSKLEVRGSWDVSVSQVEWAVVGGTGQYTLADGIVYGNVLSLTSAGRVIELVIRVFYRPLQKPTMA